MAQRLYDFLTTIEDDLVSLRHELHQCPEPGLDLPRTTGRVRREFSALGMEIHDATTVSGFCAVLRGGRGATTAPAERPLVLLRADMDGLPVEERTGLDWASTNGAMHGCGHDMHMAGLVGAARALTALRDELTGDVVFFLQPGEEGQDGAQHMIDEGLLEVAGRLPDHAYALHVWSAQFPAGLIGARPGAQMASSDSVDVVVHGRGGHGSAPHKALDPVPVIAEVITQSSVMVAREFDVFDPVVVTCGSLHAGSVRNVIPDNATGRFTIRAFSEAARGKVLEDFRRLAEGIVAAHGMTCEYQLTELYPVTANDPDEVAFAREVLGAALPGRWAEVARPQGAAEDFSKVLQRIPGCFLVVSAVPEGVDEETAPFNHSAEAVYADQRLVDCSRVLAELALARLS